MLPDIRQLVILDNPIRLSVLLIKIEGRKLLKIANQPYIPNAGHLFVFVVDQRRNTLIAEAKGAEALVQGSPERFISAFSDAMIAAQMW